MPHAPGTIMELCHVVKDMDKSIHHWTTMMGAGPFFVFDVDADIAVHGELAKGALKIGFGFSGELLIELIALNNNCPSVFQEVMDERGEGYHHVMLNLPFDEGFEKYSKAGYKPAWQGSLPSGERYVLFDTRHENSGFVEFMDVTPPLQMMLDKMQASHNDWDGKSEPIRSMESLMVP